MHDAEASIAVCVDAAPDACFDTATLQKMHAIVWFTSPDNPTFWVRTRRGVCEALSSEHSDVAALKKLLLELCFEEFKVKQTVIEATRIKDAGRRPDDLKTCCCGPVATARLRGCVQQGH